MKDVIISIIDAIKNQPLRTPEEIAAFVKQPLFAVVESLKYLEKKGYISPLYGGSREEMWKFEVIKDLP